MLKIKPILNSSAVSIFLACILIYPNLSLAQPKNSFVYTPEQTNLQTEKIILDSGLTILLKRAPRADIISFVVLIKSGTAKENQFLGSGIAHLTEHMLFKDNPEDPKSEIARRVSLLGGEITGSTSYDWTTYTITLPKENADKALELFQRFLMQPQFKSEDLEKEKQVVLKEINIGEDNPSHVLWDTLMQTAFTKHPYRFPILGYDAMLKKITLDDLNDYYRHTYTLSNIVLSIAGDFDNEKIKKKIEELFNQDRRIPILPAPQILEPQQVSTRKIIRQMKSTNLSFGAIAFKSVSIDHPDMYALDTLAAILGGGKSSRLYQKLKENLKIVYAIDSSNYTPLESGLFTITFTAEPENQEKIAQEILNEIENIKKSGVREEELKRAKQKVKSDFLFSQESSEELALLNAQFEATLGNPDFHSQYLDKIEKISPRNIQQIAIKYLIPSSLSIVSIIPALKDKVNPETKAPLALEPEIKKIVLAGGLKVLLREDKRLPIVNIKIVYLGGLLSENQKNNGISNLIAKLLLKGTKSKNAYEISRLIESWGTNVESFSGSNYSAISLKILKDNLSEALKLLSEIITSPAFDPLEIEKEKNLTLAQIKQQKEDIFNVGTLLLKKELYQGHPYSFNPLGSLETIKNLTRDEIIDFYFQKIYKPNMLISVFGDIDSNETLSLISKYFHSISPKGESLYLAYKASVLNRTSTAFEILEKEQAIFMLGFRTCSLINPDKYALSLVCEVLSGIDGRLFKNIRKNLGIAYTLAGYNVELLNGGHFIFYVATTKENLKKAQEKIWQEIKALKKDSITKEELERAKKSLIGKRKISLETNEGLTLRASFDELYGLGFQNYKDYQRNINYITTKEVKEVINKYFNNNYVEVFVSPSSFLLEESPARFSLKNILAR